MEKLHHVNIIPNGQGRVAETLSFIEQNLFFNPKQNPDFLLIEADTFGIDEARDFIRWAFGKPLAGDQKVAVLNINSITLESQNALLKIFEEPALGTYIFLLLPNLANVLPTLLSRVQILALAEPMIAQNDDKYAPAKKFLHLSPGARLNLIKQWSKSDKKSEFKSLLQNLEKSDLAQGLDYGAKKRLLTAKIFSAVRGGSPKMLLEWLSCVL